MAETTAHHRIPGQIERVARLLTACDSDPHCSPRNRRKARKWLARLTERHNLLCSARASSYSWVACTTSIDAQIARLEGCSS